MAEFIKLTGVATHNLRSIDVALPLGKLTVVTGVSGSGKSSLVFDTLYAESYRRYVNSLSSYARQYLKALPKPALTSVENLPPAIAVRQGRGESTNRSTVGTATELIDLLRIIFSEIGSIFCNSCKKPVQSDNPSTVVTALKDSQMGRKILILAPLARWGKVPVKVLKEELVTQGFTRILTAGNTILRLEEAKAADLKLAAVVIDRLTVTESSLGRLSEAVSLGFKVGRGTMAAADHESYALLHSFSEGLDCAGCGHIYREPTPSLLSFNNPVGACKGCQGFGLAAELDREKVIPDISLSLSSQGVAPWNFGKFVEYYDWAKVAAVKQGIDIKKPFSQYTEEDWDFLYNGIGRTFDGVTGFFKYLDQKKYKPHYRIHAARFKKYVTCTECGGRRLNSDALSIKMSGKTIADVAAMPLYSLKKWVDELPAAEVIHEAITDMQSRLTYLIRIGVGYLSLDRSSRTLSGGELQRIHMARCLGSALTDTLYCLDEPSSGLHARDSKELLSLIQELCHQGNTVVMVEHEKKLISGADHLIEIGPLAGSDGGRVVYTGKPQLPAAPQITRPIRTLSDFIAVKHASIHNLKNISVQFPTGAVTAVCGVSGSGKSSLVRHTVVPLLEAAFASNGKTLCSAAGAEVAPWHLIKQFAGVQSVGQGGIGRSSRSNIATYLGMMDGIRKILAATSEAKNLGLKAGAFSFNVARESGGGRCETCRGLGKVTEDLSFLGEMDVTCPACEGQRFDEAVLSVTYKGKNLIEILALTVADARLFFYEVPEICHIADRVLELGLGFITLGQSTDSFSGGEAQRLKLLAVLSDKRLTQPSILIFDEPTTGLSDKDVAQLMSQLHSLSDLGHTVIVVEHHLDVLKAADWLIEIGPEAGELGGELVYQGPPREIARAVRSVTAPFLLQ